jgi:hypothetical protein
MRFSRVTVQYGEPFKFDVVSETTRTQQQEAADYIFGRIRELYSDLQGLGHTAARRSRRQNARNESGRGVP